MSKVHELDVVVRIRGKIRIQADIPGEAVQHAQQMNKVYLSGMWIFENMVDRRLESFGVENIQEIDTKSLDPREWIPKRRQW
jgi:hypothetical protein